ncbi:hypothetical protein, partial [Rhodococcus jostii]|uniref:hypothetical protein n=1 Tax=Rhodococcus jostii TaxID=132919 RepID=UPI00364D2C4C
MSTEQIEVVGVEAIVRDLAKITAAEQILSAAKATLKDRLQKELRQGTVYAFDYSGEGMDPIQLGYATIPKPSQPSPQVEIDDEARVLVWAVEMFGESAMTVRLTEQGRMSVIAYALDQHAAAGKPAVFAGVDGVIVRVPASRPAAPRFTPAKNVVELIRGMVARGALSFADLIAIEEGRP